MADTFHVGDIVQMKSGGPKMTITAIDKDVSDRGVAECQWFAGDDLKKAILFLSSLKAAKESDP
ncbi:MAG TPA: DUF2158 domain-containing protein [Stellaceae bacterium]|nr:DUF2158 domain-containing protein [Stellaceae bacterium]